MASKLSINMFKFLLLSLLFITFSLAKGTPRLDDVENKLSESEKTMMKQEFNVQNLQIRIDELKVELKKLKNTQADYRIEKSSYDSKMQSNTDLISSQDNRISDINFYFLFWGVLITIILLIVFWKSRQEAKDVAKEEAQNFMDKWIEKEATKLIDIKIDEVLATKNDGIDELIKTQIKEKIKPLTSKVEASIKDIEMLVKDIENTKEKASSHVKDIEKIKLSIPTISQEVVEKIEKKETSSLSAHEYYQLAINAYHKNKFNTALNEIENSIKLSNDDSNELVNSFVLKGASLTELKEYNQAIEAYKKAIEINPKNYMAYFNMGIAYVEKGEYDQGIEAYKKAIKINPKDDDSYNNMGIIYVTKGEYDQAIEAYKKAIEINPKNDDVYYNIGIVYSKKGEYDQAIKAYKKAIEINPNNSFAYNNLFEIQLTQQQLFDEVLEQKYIELFQEKKKSFIKYEMLKTVQNIFHNKEVNLEEWREKYEGVSLGSWSFDELNDWVDGMEDVAVPEKLKEAIEVFEGHI